MLACEISCKRLAEMATTASRRIPARPTVPVLAGTLVEVADTLGDGMLMCSSFDWDVSITASHVVTGEIRPGRALVSGRLFEALVKTLPPTKTARLEQTDSDLTIECGTIRLTLPTMTIDDYPTLPMQGNPLGVVDGKAFATFVRRCCVAVDVAGVTAVPALSGLKLHFRDTTIGATGSDRYRGVVAALPWQTSLGQHEDVPIDLALVVPGAMLLDAVHETGSGEVRITAGDGTIGIHAAGFSTVGRLLELDKFPKSLETLAPPRVDKPLLFDVAEMTAALKRTMLVIDGGKTQVFPVRLEFADAACVISSGQSGSEEIRGRTVTTIDATTPDPIKVMVNGRYLVEGLAALGTDTAEMSVNPENPRTPFLLTAPGDTDYRQFVMPVR